MAVFALARDFDGQIDRGDGQCAGADINSSCTIGADCIRSGIFDRCRCRLLRLDGSLTICSRLNLRLPDQLVVVLEGRVVRGVRQAELIIRRQAEGTQVVANHLARAVDKDMRIGAVAVAARDTADCRILLVGCIIGHAAHSVESVFVIAHGGEGNGLIRADAVRLRIPGFQEAADALIGISRINADQLEGVCGGGIVRTVSARALIGVPEFSGADGVCRIKGDIVVVGIVVVLVCIRRIIHQGNGKGF